MILTPLSVRFAPRAIEAARSTHANSSGRRSAQCLWKKTPAVFVAVDPHVRYLESHGLYRMNMGFSGGVQADYTTQKIFKVRNDRLVEAGTFQDAITFFDTFEISFDHQARMPSSHARPCPYSCLLGHLCVRRRTAADSSALCFLRVHVSDRERSVHGGVRVAAQRGQPGDVGGVDHLHRLLRVVQRRGKDECYSLPAGGLE